MGAWGANSFQNDDAMDWLGDLEHEGMKAITAAFQAVPLDQADDVEAPEASAAIAAAEIVAALDGKPSKTLLPWAAEWIKGKSKPSRDSVQMARLIVDRIIAASELRDLWEESESHFGEWNKHVEDLQNRLA
jgi:hypothetical protein